MTGGRTPLLATALGGVLLLAALAGCAGSSSPAASGPTVPVSATSPVRLDVSVTGGVVSPPPADLTVPVGSTVRLRISSDAADEVHVHGYDLERRVPAGGSVTLDLVADRVGTFEVEGHDSGLLLTRLVVS